MKLTFQKKYISIDHFNEVEMPDFVVLTGLNGSGKSHLLEAIENRSVSVGNTHYQRIIRFDYRNFYLENEAAYNARQIIDEKNNAWSFFSTQQNWKINIASFKNNLGVNYEKLVDIAKLKNKPFLELSKNDIGNDSIHAQYESYKISLYNFINQDSFKNNQQAQSVASVIKRIQKSADELEKEEFDDVFRPYQFKNDFLPNQLGKIIWDYYSRYRNNEVNEFQKAKYPEKASYTVLSEEEFEKVHGKKPWVILNEILENFETIEYRFPSPEGSEYFADFQLKLVHKSRGLKLDFSSLSSGEKVLMALIASIYKTASDNHFPDILLLDEIDASLHPSMIKNLLDAIQNIFISRGTKVILVTHSPTTVALASDESVYVMNKFGSNRIEKVSKNHAVNILTEGFATLDEGLRIFTEISKRNLSIISEGHNKKFIELALNLNGITDIEILDGLSWCGETELKTIFNFLVQIPHQEKDVLIAWDPDMQNKYGCLRSCNHTHPFVFTANEKNKLTKKLGIENLFDEQVIRDGGFVITASNGKGEKIDEHFDESKKNDFADFVISRNNKDDFKNFQSLIDKVNELKQSK